MKIYVGNLPFDATEKDLQEAFGAFGQVETVNIIKDSYTGKSRGFGFVEMPTGAEAQSAINDMNGKDLKGRTLKVNEARSRTEGHGGGGDRGRRRPGGGGGGGRPGGGGGWGRSY